MAQLLVGLLQADPVRRTLTEALFQLEEALEEFAMRGIQLLITPELYLSGYGDKDLINTVRV